MILALLTQLMLDAQARYHKSVCAKHISAFTKRHIIDDDPYDEQTREYLEQKRKEKEESDGETGN